MTQGNRTDDRLRIVLGGLACVPLILLSTSEAATLSPPIAPGDVVFTTWRNGWYKLEPESGVVTPLPWGGGSEYATTLRFDTDGALLFARPDPSDGYSTQDIWRLDPRNGDSSPLGLLLGPPDWFDTFYVESEDAFLLRDNAYSESQVWRVDRRTLEFTDVTPQTEWLPPRIRDALALDPGVTLGAAASSDLLQANGFAYGPSGEYYIIDEVDGTNYATIRELDPAGLAPPRQVSATGAIEIDLWLPPRMELSPDGDLFIGSWYGGTLYRVETESGMVHEYTPPIGYASTKRFAFDSIGGLWLGGNSSVYLIDPATGAVLRDYPYPPEYYPVTSIVVVPDGWTPPPVPEPGAGLLAGTMAASWWARRRVAPTK